MKVNMKTLLENCIRFRQNLKQQFDTISEHRNIGTGQLNGAELIRLEVYGSMIDIMTELITAEQIREDWIAQQERKNKDEK